MTLSDWLAFGSGMVGLAGFISALHWRQLDRANEDRKQTAIEHNMMRAQIRDLERTMSMVYVSKEEFRDRISVVDNEMTGIHQDIREIRNVVVGRGDRSAG